jgi:hypothetical protein
MMLEAMEEGTLDPKDIAAMALSWLSEDEVKDMCRANDLLDFCGMGEEEDDEDLDDEIGDGLTDAEADELLLSERDDY